MKIAILSSRLRNLAKAAYYSIFNRKILPSYLLYNFSDEKLKYTHILEAMNYIRVAGDVGEIIPQTFFEFGCHSARTFSMAINASSYLRMTDTQFYAFDSFEGLPETSKDDDGYFETGTFHTSEANFKKLVRKNTGLKLNKENVIPGFYEESLSENLSLRLPKIGVLHIDVDLYSSTKTVLNFVKSLLVDGSVILFDDFYCFKPTVPSGENKALLEFLSDNKEISIIPWKAYSTFGQSFFVKIDQTNNV